jgi:hypothetical protein
MNNEDDRIIVNLSVWEDVDSLHEYVYESAHHKLLRDRKRWFQKFDGPYYALWWVPVGQLPSTQEGKERLDILRKYGDTAYAFSFKHLFPGPAME